MGGSSDRTSDRAEELCVADVGDTGLASKQQLMKALRLERDRLFSMFPSHGDRPCVHMYLSSLCFFPIVLSLLQIRDVSE